MPWGGDSQGPVSKECLLVPSWRPFWSSPQHGAPYRSRSCHGFLLRSQSAFSREEEIFPLDVGLLMWRRRFLRSAFVLPGIHTDRRTCRRQGEDLSLFCKGRRFDQNCRNASPDTGTVSLPLAPCSLSRILGEEEETYVLRPRRSGWGRAATWMGTERKGWEREKRKSREWDVVSRRRS